MHSFMHTSRNGVAPSTRHTYQSGLKPFVARLTFHLSLHLLSVMIFCADVLQDISYINLKVYLAAFCLLDILTMISLIPQTAAHG